MALPVEAPEPSHSTYGINVINEFMSEESAAREKELYPEMSYLGAGAQGVVVDLGNGSIGKYTNKDGEAWIAKEIMEKGGIPGLVNVYDVREIEPYLWMIVMERVNPLNVDEAAFIDALNTLYLSQKPILNLDFVLEQVEEEIYSVDIDYDDAAVLHEDYKSLVDKLEQSQVSLQDAHGSNVGYNSQNELVLFDLGIT